MKLHLLRYLTRCVPKYLELKILKENMYRNGQIKEEETRAILFLLVLLVSWFPSSCRRLLSCDVGPGGGVFTASQRGSTRWSVA